MGDEPKKRSWGWTWGLPIVAAALYVLSPLPAVLAAAWMIHWGLLSQEAARSTFGTIYAPIAWVADNSEPIREAYEWVGELAKPIFPDDV